MNIHSTVIDNITIYDIGNGGAYIEMNNGGCCYGKDVDELLELCNDYAPVGTGITVMSVEFDDKLSCNK